MAKYKIWMYLEEIDEDEEETRDIEGPIEVACFESEIAAREQLWRLEAVGGAA